MKVLIVREDNHGIITIAKDFASAIKFLIEDKWLDEDYCVFHNWEQHITIKKDLGSNWLEKVEQMGIEKFNKYFHGGFNLESREVYE